MELKNLSKVRRLAVFGVIANIVVVAAAALAAPKELLVVLPLLGLTLPLLTAAALEAAAERRLGDGFSG